MFINKENIILKGEGGGGGGLAVKEKEEEGKFLKFLDFSSVKEVIKTKRFFGIQMQFVVHLSPPPSSSTSSPRDTLVG